MYKMKDEKRRRPVVNSMAVISTPTSMTMFEVLIACLLYISSRYDVVDHSRP